MYEGQNLQLLLSMKRVNRTHMGALHRAGVCTPELSDGRDRGG